MALAPAQVVFDRGEMAVVTLSPGDRLVVMFQVELSASYRERLMVMMKEWAPDIPCVVLDGGVHLGVIRTSGEELPPPPDSEGTFRRRPDYV